MMRKIGLTTAAVLMLAAGSGAATTASAGPGICEETLEPAMQQYQFFDDDTQAVIDSLSPCKD